MATLITENQICILQTVGSNLNHNFLRENTVKSVKKVLGAHPNLRARILNASVRSSVQNALDIDMPCRYGSSLCCMASSVKKRRARKATNSKHGNPTQNKVLEAKFNSVKAKEVMDFFQD